jgi:hypothetical protein
MPRRKVEQVLEGRWMEWTKREQWICCDCNLVHTVEHRERDGKLEVRFLLENRSTAAYRRTKKNADRGNSRSG